MKETSLKKQNHGLNIFLHQLKNGRQHILYLLQIADFSHGIEFIYKAVIGQYNLLTIFLHSHWRKQCMDIQRDRNLIYVNRKFPSLH